MKPYKRIFTVVIDSLGIGTMPNATEYNDEGTDAPRHIDSRIPEFQTPDLTKLGLANLHPPTHVEAVEWLMGYYGRLLEANVGRDTMTGHWGMMGLHIAKPLRIFTDTEFPQELPDELSRWTGHRIVGSKSASGTEILDELAEHEIATDDMTVYTPADSVLQICGNEETFGLDGSCRCYEVAKELTIKDEWKANRIIARPYVGKKKGEFKRTPNRHSYALKSYGKTALNALKESGYDVISIRRVKDILDSEGITEAYESKSSVHGVERALEIADKDFRGLCFVNLVDFDTLWGHRRDPEGYGQELERFDVKLDELLPRLREDDLLLVTADHGNDPTYKGANHTREMVPLLIYSSSVTGDGRLPGCDTFAMIGTTITDNFKVPMPEGTIEASILKKLS